MIIARNPFIVIIHFLVDFSNYMDDNNLVIGCFKVGFPTWRKYNNCCGSMRNRRYCSNVYQKRQRIDAKTGMETEI